MLEHIRWLERVLRRARGRSEDVDDVPPIDERFVVASRLAHAQYIRLRGPEGTDGLRAEAEVLRSLMNAVPAD